MKEELYTQDYDLICSTLVAGSYSLDIYSSSRKIETKKSNIEGPQENPSSLIFISQSDELVLTDDYDYIIDFTGSITLPSNYQKTEFILSFNADGSIHCMYEEAKKVSHLTKRNSDKKVSVYYKNHLFFEKQIRHLPSDQYLISFGASQQERHILITLYLKNQHIIDLKIAYNHETLYEIYRQKYFMSKLSFYDFESIEIPHEYFSKNQRIVINSVSHKTKVLPDLREHFSRYLTEITDKTATHDSIRKSTFYAEMLTLIGTIQDKLAKELLHAYLTKIPMHEHFYFGLSFEKLEQQSLQKLACSDLTEANFHAPLLSDFFFQIIEEIKLESFTEILDLQKYLENQVDRYDLRTLINRYNVDVLAYFRLFVIYYMAKKPHLVNVQFLKHIQQLQGMITIAS